MSYLNTTDWCNTVETLHFFIEKLHNGIFGNRTGALADAVLACKLRIPRKPELVDSRSICQTCHNNKGPLNKCCDNCGQAIDWNDNYEVFVQIDKPQCTIDDYPNAWDPGGMPPPKTNFKSHIEPSYRKNEAI